jgi:hypothetical protein
MSEKDELILTTESLYLECGEFLELIAKDRSPETKSVRNFIKGTMSDLKQLLEELRSK